MRSITGRGQYQKASRLGLFCQCPDTVSRLHVYFRPMYFGPMGKVAGTRNMEPWKDPRKRKRVMNYLGESREPRNGR
jgi:hypothetical protein